MILKIGSRLDTQVNTQVRLKSILKSASILKSILMHRHWQNEFAVIEFHNPLEKILYFDLGEGILYVSQVCCLPPNINRQVKTVAFDPDHSGGGMGAKGELPAPPVPLCSGVSG